jgi:hypothetical protein
MTTPEPRESLEAYRARVDAAIKATLLELSDVKQKMQAVEHARGDLKATQKKLGKQLAIHLGNLQSILDGSVVLNPQLPLFPGDPTGGVSSEQSEESSVGEEKDVNKSAAESSADPQADVGLAS